MIATLEGNVSEKISDLVVLEVNGVGYGLLVTLGDFGKLQVDSPAKLYVYEHIRENSYDIYGFSELSTKTLFEKLIEVNGVGPRMALSILSMARPEEVRQAIASGDVKFIQQANGVGKRIAERVVVELKDKVGLNTSVDNDALFKGEGVILQDDAVLALVSLGFSSQDALTALKAVDDSLPIEERVKIALKEMK